MSQKHYAIEIDNSLGEQINFEDGQTYSFGPRKTHEATPEKKGSADEKKPRQEGE